MNKIMQRRKGFTLIEALVAVAIIALAVAGPMYSARSALVAAGNAKNRLTASYLAQEGIEYVRMVRDNQFLTDRYATNPTQTAWDNFINSSAANVCTGALGCTLDPWAGGSGPLQACNTSACTPLYLDESSTPKRYTQGTGNVTPYTRIIKIVSISGTNTERQIISEVRWTFHNTNYSVIVTDHITSWQ